MNKVLGSFFLALFLAFSPTNLAQQAPPPDQTPTIRHTVQEVLLQVVVHDSHGRIVKNLKPDEIEVYENGVRQQIRSFRLISGRDVVVKNTVAKRAAPAIVAPSNPLKAVNLVCIVFSNLDPYTKKFAVDAAREFLNSQFDPDTWVAVFNLDTKLHVLQAFTTNRNDVMDAASKAFTAPTVDFAQVATAVLNAAPNMVTMEATALGVGGHAGAVAETATVSGGEVNTNVFVGADVATGDSANRQRGDLVGQRRQFGAIEGMREMDQIEAMIRQLATLPGHKSVLLFSPGLATTGDPDLFQAMVNRATKSNVTVYAIDVNGLSADVDQAQASSNALKHAAALSSTQGSRRTSSALSTEQMRQDDYVNDAVRTTDTQAALRALSEDTGGFLIGSTNDLRKPFQRLLEDVDTHYEVIYQPSSHDLDGRFRSIEVKSTRADLTAQSRPGYFALPVLPDTSELSPTDMSGLAALTVHKPPHFFDFKTAVYQFRPGAVDSQNALAFEIPARSLQATPEPGLNRRRFHVGIFALVKDSTGLVVSKFSKDSSYEVPEENLAKAQATTISFDHALSLPPGRYTLETAILDGERGLASTGTSTFESPEQKGVGLSSILLVKHMEPVTGKVERANPFEFEPAPNQGQRVIPELGTDLAADAKPYVYFLVYPDRSIPEKPKIEAEFWLGGKLLAKQTAELPAPDATGAIPMMINPAAKPGQCEMRVTAVQGGSRATQSLKYSIASN